MELAKVTSKGQITIPVEIRRKLRLKEGDKGRIFFENSSQMALKKIQKEYQTQVANSTFETEEDVVNYIKKIRSESDSPA